MKPQQESEFLKDGLKELEKAGSKEFVDKIRENRVKAAKAFKDFTSGLGKEAKETGEASKILVKFLKEGKVSSDEEKELRTQVYDLLKMVGIGVPFFLIPGSSLLLPFLIKLAEKRGVNLLPTAFSDKKDKEDPEADK